jgi:hypothetical protein
MSKGWVHYGYHTPEPQILLFRRPFTGDGENPRLKFLKSLELEKKDKENDNDNEEKENKDLNSNNDEKKEKKKIVPPKPTF